jgi:hypothetical protein
MPLLQPGDFDVLVGTRDVPRPRGTRRSRQPASGNPAYCPLPALDVLPVGRLMPKSLGSNLGQAWL